MQTEHLQVRVTNIHPVTSLIRELRLEPLQGELLPFSPGSHVIVEMHADKNHKNAYSLLSDPRDTKAYRIAVRLQENSRGGSKFIHEQVKLGDVLSISPPANLFAPYWPAKHHVLLAGGVGITPFMAYLPEMQRQNADIELHYMFRGHQTGAFREELRDRLGERYHEYDADEHRVCSLTDVLTDRPVGTHIYVCGPEKLLAGVLDVAASIGIPTSAIHYEEFSAPKPGTPFETQVSSTGQIIQVGPEESLLEALESAGIEIPNLCRGGVCGQCQCRVVSGAVEHRDNFLSDDEKLSGGAIMPCVSRSSGSRLVLDI